jgi:hypothetical protein
MGIELRYFVLYPPPRPDSPWLLARVIRPSAPNSSEPAIDFAEALAHLKANALVRAWLASVGDSPGSVPTAIGHSSWDPDATSEHPINAFLGSELEVWWTCSNANPASLAIAPARDEAEFWRWIDGQARNRNDSAVDLRRPAERVRVRLLTEADARLVDHPLLLVEDLDWLSEAQFEQLDRHRGLEAELKEVLAMQPIVTPEEMVEAKAELLEAALEHADLHLAAFLCIDLARFDPDAAMEWIQILTAEADEDADDDDGPYIPDAFASALHALRGHPECEALIERWQGADGLPAEILAALAKHE